MASSPTSSPFLTGQLFCGISVVDGKEWEALKRYNVNALYGMSPEEKSAAGGRVVESAPDAAAPLS